MPLDPAPHLVRESERGLDLDHPQKWAALPQYWRRPGRKGRRLEWLGVDARATWPF